MKTRTVRRDVQLTVYITPEMSTALRERAAGDGRTISSLAERLLRDTLPTTTESAIVGRSAQVRELEPAA